MIKDKPKGKGPCPTWFWARCKTAAQGGSEGYDSAGYELARHLESLEPDDLDGDDWAATLEAIQAFIQNRNDMEAFALLDLYLPRCTAMVPAQRRKKFMEGFRECIDDGNSWV
jgi:hypothetical protein